ncbi:BON domain-containing protein [Luteimonas sp. SJ-16]|uniref:Osmotically-inducible protein Y n=2 Tax=Luteimonas deserti TaxID=2752306 RepID=A0A7Z0QQI5_9GAMM|nr:BON domain-containing protein [Luteimonas deserti]
MPANDPATQTAPAVGTADTTATGTTAGTMDDSRMGMDGDGRDSNQPVDDTWITTKVKSSLLADSDVSGLDIQVETVNGVVTLTGQVDQQMQIDEATRIAREIEGVTDVQTAGLTMGRAAN